MRVTQTKESIDRINQKAAQVQQEADQGKITTQEAEAQAIAFAKAHAEFEMMPTDANHSPFGRVY